LKQFDPQREAALLRIQRNVSIRGDLERTKAGSAANNTDAWQTPAQVKAAEGKLELEKRYAAELKRSQIERSMRNNVLPFRSAPESVYSSDEYEDAVENTEAETERLRNESKSRDISQLNPLRQQLGDVADRGRQEVQQAVQKKMQEYAKRAVVQIGGDAINAVDSTGWSAWISYLFLTLPWVLIRAPISLIPRGETKNIQSLSDAGGVLAKEAVFAIFPPYKPFSGNPVDITDFAYFLWSCVAVGVIFTCITMALVLIIIIIAAVTDPAGTFATFLGIN
jgi:hypothetical protein